MSIATTFLDGALVPYTRLGSDTLLARPAIGFIDRFRLNVFEFGFESRWVGEKLIVLATRNGEWHGVPWRMLRNEFMQLVPAIRSLLRRELVPPMQHVEDPELVQMLNVDPYLYEMSLYIGLRDLLKDGMAVRADINREAYFFPTDNLLARTYRVDTDGNRIADARA